MTSQYETVLGILANPDTNYIEVDYKGKADQPLAAWVRKMTGETVDHVKSSCFFGTRMVATKTTSLLLTMARDTGSRNKKGAYDFRSLRLAALSPTTFKPEQWVVSIRSCKNFGSWETTNLEGMPIFPDFNADYTPSGWASLFLALRHMEEEAAVLSKVLDHLKRKLKKGSVFNTTHRLFYRAPEGTTNRIVDAATGEPIKRTTSKSWGLQLQMLNPPFITVNKADFKVEDAPAVFVKIADLRRKAEVLRRSIRPYELGIIERFNGDITKPFKVGGVDFVIKNVPISASDWTEEDRERVKAGEYKIEAVPKTRGSWVCEPVEIAVPSETETVKEPVGV